MKQATKKLWLALAAFAVLGLASTASAYTPTVNLDIRVSINASKSVAVNTTFYNFGPLAINATQVSASSITVTNDSGGLVETYTIQGASATPVGAGTNWALAASVGQDQYALGAQFSDTAGALQGTWANDDTTFLAVPCSTDQFGNNVAGQSGAGVLPAGVRGLWFRIKTPSSVTDTVEHKATITLAVQ